MPVGASGGSDALRLPHCALITPIVQDSAVRRQVRGAARASVRVASAAVNCARHRYRSSSSTLNSDTACRCSARSCAITSRWSEVQSASSTASSP